MRYWLPLLLLTASLQAIDPKPLEKCIASQPVQLCWQEDKTEGLFISLHTERLLVRSILPQDLEAYCALFADPIAMVKYATGAIKTPSETTQRFQNSWLARWHQGDPFSAFAVTLIIPGVDYHDYPVIGHVVMGYGDFPGQSELAFAFFPMFWDQGYGKEAVAAVVHTLGPKLVRCGYELEGKPFYEITSTSRSDNIASNKILERLGMHEVGRSDKYGHERIHFSLPVEELSH